MRRPSHRYLPHAHVAAAARMNSGSMAVRTSLPAPAVSGRDWFICFDEDIVTDAVTDETVTRL